jgi:hypothetical protein
MRVQVIAVLIAAAAVLAPRHTAAHVAPAVDENNRYIKLSPMGSRLQLAYVLFVGEVPGAELRKSMGSDPQRHAEKLASEIADKLVLTVDGTPTAISWDRVAVDLTASKEHPNALSVSMVAWVCMDEASNHRLELRDSFELPPPGENELVVEPGPGVVVDSSSLGGDTGNKLDWIGLPNPMTEDGYVLELSVDLERAVSIDDGRCKSPTDVTAETESESEQGSTRGLLFGGIAVALVLLALLALQLKRGRRI